MPGKMITDQQVAIYMNNRKAGKTQITSTARAGISERSGRNIEKGIRVLKPERTHRTRKDPFEGIFEKVAVPLLKKGVFQGTFLLSHLQKMFPGKYSSYSLRTLQRRIRKWKALHTDKEVMFLQKKEAGRLVFCDFTHPKKIKVSINGKPFKHILFHIRLPFSLYSFVQAFEGVGESLEKFSSGLNNGLHHIGGVPEKLRSDSMSAAYKNLNKEAKEDLTARFKAVVEHYGMEPTRNNRGKGHENGAVEAAHRHIKDRLLQSLIVRGSTNFISLEEYQAFIVQVVREHNQNGPDQLLKSERLALRPLPLTKAIDYTELTAVVSSTSTIEVRKVTYTVPSNLIREKLLVRIYSKRLECYLGRTPVIKLNRVFPSSKTVRARNIDYRHVIGSLVKKPQAFRGLRYRDDLLPNDLYRSIWTYVDSIMESRSACRFMVGLLHLAATQKCESELADTVIDKINKEQSLKLSALQDMFRPKNEPPFGVSVLQHGLSSYNELITGDSGVNI